MHEGVGGHGLQLLECIPSQNAGSKNQVHPHECLLKTGRLETSHGMNMLLIDICSVRTAVVPRLCSVCCARLQSLHICMCQ